MTYALILMKGQPTKREALAKKLHELYKDEKHQIKIQVEILYFLISFGWADFIILLKCNNIELVKSSIIQILRYCHSSDDSISTSTIICTTLDELEEKKGVMVDTSSTL